MHSKVSRWQVFSKIQLKPTNVARDTRCSRASTLRLLGSALEAHLRPHLHWAEKIFLDQQGQCT